MNATTANQDVGIIVGRFQFHELQPDHINQIQEILDKHNRVIIVLGNSPVRNTFNNPLDFRPRAEMIKEKFPKMEVIYIKDVALNEEWSRTLDKLIHDHIKTTQTVLIYGSKDNFLNRYTGKFPTQELETKTFISDAEIRRGIINGYNPSKDFRAGMIAATAERFPTAFQCVDIAIVNENGTEMLIARKPLEKKWRFVGGFSDPNSESLEIDAKRETQEETGVEVDNITYLGSTKIKDWRYAGERDCIKTALFVAKYIFGRPKGADDIAEVKWVKINEVQKKDFVDEHHVLLDIFMTKFLLNKDVVAKVLNNK